MTYLYFDDSKHYRFGFVLGTFVIVDHDPHEVVAKALRDVGMTPGQDEFKSATRAEGNRAHAQLRSELLTYLEFNCFLATVIVPADDEFALGAEALNFLPSVLRGLGPQDARAQAYFDTGLFRGDLAAQVRDGTHAFAGCSLNIEQDSRIVLGIQLADLAAHLCGSLLQVQLGRAKKSFQYQNPSTDEYFEASLDWELWYRLRRRFLAQTLDIEEDTLVVSTEPFGLRIADTCPEALREAARAAFGQMYVGCVW